MYPRDTDNPGVRCYCRLYSLDDVFLRNLVDVVKESDLLYRRACSFGRKASRLMMNKMVVRRCEDFLTRLDRQTVVNQSKSHCRAVCERDLVCFAAEIFRCGGLYLAGHLEHIFFDIIQ